jgi:hypothetical protein
MDLRGNYMKMRGNDNTNLKDLFSQFRVQIFQHLTEMSSLDLETILFTVKRQRSFEIWIVIQLNLMFLCW